MGKKYTDKGISDKKTDDLKESRKEYMELMADESKPHFNNILWRLTKLVELIWRKC